MSSTPSVPERILPEPSLAIDVPLTNPPSMKKVIAMALWRNTQRKQGELCVSPVPALVITRKAAPILATRLTAYKRICGDEGVEVPPVFVESLFVKLLAALLIHPKFPVSPFGIIHMRQTISAFKPLVATDELDLSCAIRELRITERGIELDVLLSADKNGERVWEGLSTFLTRNAKTMARGKEKREEKREEPPVTRALFDVPEDTGRQYAYVSDDYNLIHLYPITAKMMGFKRAIAHGIWTMGRAVAALPAENRPAACFIDASFKRPLFLPGAIGMVYDDTPAGQPLDFKVVKAGSATVHLVGTIKPL